MANLATKPSSRDDGLVARLAISTNMLHKPDAPGLDFRVLLVLRYYSSHEHGVACTRAYWHILY